MHPKATCRLRAPTSTEQVLQDFIFAYFLTTMTVGSRYSTFPTRLSLSQVPTKFLPRQDIKIEEEEEEEIATK